MMNPLPHLSLRTAFACGSLAVVAVLAGCSGGSPGDRDNRGDFKVTSISTGRGTVYPYRIRAADSFGNPTTTVLNIEDETTMKQNVSGNNGVLPVATFDTTLTLPNGDPGNQFIHFTFSHKLDVDSILSDLLANQSNSGLTGSLNVIAYDPALLRQESEIVYANPRSSAAGLLSQWRRYGEQLLLLLPGLASWVQFTAASAGMTGSAALLRG